MGRSIASVQRSLFSWADAAGCFCQLNTRLSTISQMVNLKGSLNQKWRFLVARFGTLVRLFSVLILLITPLMQCWFAWKHLKSCLLTWIQWSEVSDACAEWNTHQYWSVNALLIDFEQQHGYDSYTSLNPAIITHVFIQLNVVCDSLGSWLTLPLQFNRLGIACLYEQAKIVKSDQWIELLTHCSLYFGSAFC